MKFGWLIRGFWGGGDRVAVAGFSAILVPLPVGGWSLPVDMGTDGPIFWVTEVLPVGWFPLPVEVSVCLLVATLLGVLPVGGRVLPVGLRFLAVFWYCLRVFSCMF